MITASQMLFCLCSFIRQILQTMFAINIYCQFKGKTKLVANKKLNYKFNKKILIFKFIKYCLIHHIKFYFRIAKREKYSRRRIHNDDADIDYINERNMKFNKKLERFYGQYTTEIKQNLERGTAV